MASKKLPRKSQKTRSPWIRRLKQGIVLFLTFVFIGFSALGFLLFNAHRDAEDAMVDLEKRIDSGMSTPTTRILSRDGQVLFSVSKESRTPLKLEQIPKFVQNAVIAAEDRRFYQHSGVDLTSMARIVFVDMRGRKLSQGGSTITMQLVKLLFNGSSRTFKRKLNDIAYAQVLEQKLPKDRILELYLNKVFFGNGAFGIGEAAKVYFNKNIDDLTIGEAAMLARCIRRPSYENPIRDLETATTNRDVVLGIMRDEQMITEDQYEKAIDEKPHVNPKPTMMGVYVRAGTEHFVKHVTKFLEKDLGLDLMTGGYTIETSLDLSLQKLALRTVQDYVDENRHLKMNQAAFMVMDSDGYILAEIGALDFAKHQYNLVTSLNALQPGSGFKPIVYATALKQGTITMDSMISNAPISEPDGPGRMYTPKNSDPKKENQSAYSLRSALAYSINLCAIHTIYDVGPAQVVQTAYDSFGFRSTLHPYPSLALGSSEVSPLEMAEAYSVFMLHGDRVHPQPVVRVTDADGNQVKQYDPQKTVGAFDSHVADEVDELLKCVVEYGTGTAAQKVPNARGKTGTTNDAKDAWFTGYADGVLAVGWFGHEVWNKANKSWDRAPMNRAVYGGNSMAKVWADVMVVARQKYGKSVNGPSSKPSDKPKVKAPPIGDDVDPDLIAMPADAKDSSPQLGDGSKPSTNASSPPNDSTAPPTSGDLGTKPDSAGTGPADSSKPPKGDSTDVAGGPSASTKPETQEKAIHPKRTQKPKDDTDSDTVTVEICEDSGLLANPYCPETVTRTFKRGKEPKRKCRIHGSGG